MKDLAERANVSRIAISKVLLNTGGNNVRVGKDKREKILAIASKMNYRPNIAAQMLTGKSSKIIGVLIDSYAPQVRFKTLSVAEEILAQKGFRLIIGQTHNNYENFKSYITDFASRRVDAIMCFAHEYPNFNISKDFDSFENIVFVGQPQLENTNFVEVDIQKGIEKLVEHLCKNGRKKIGLWGITSGSTQSHLRERGYQEGLKAQKLKFDVELISYCFNNPPTKNDCLDVIDYLVKEKKADTIIANNDIWAIKLIKYLKKCGFKVPQDIAVAGFDNIDIAEMYDPELTTIDPQCERQGQIIAEMILKMINNKKEEISQQIIDPILIVRESA